METSCPIYCFGDGGGGCVVKPRGEVREGVRGWLFGLWEVLVVVRGIERGMY